MSEQIREQVSAFLDGELPASETELLLKRLTRDAELRESFGRYGLIGEAMRGSEPAHLTRGFAARVNRAIDGEPAFGGAATPGRPHGAGGGRWPEPRWPRGSRPWPWLRCNSAGQPADRGGGRTGCVARRCRLRPQWSGEAFSYTVPRRRSAGPPPRHASGARLTNYVFAHSKYSSLLGQRNVLSGLIAEPPIRARPRQADAAP